MRTWKCVEKFIQNVNTGPHCITFICKTFVSIMVELPFHLMQLCLVCVISNSLLPQSSQLFLLMFSS